MCIRDSSSPDNVDLDISWDNANFYYKWQYYKLENDLEDDLAGLTLLESECVCTVRLRGDKDGLKDKLIPLNPGEFHDLRNEKWSGSDRYSYEVNNASDYVTDVLVCCSDLDSQDTINNCFFSEKNRREPKHR